MCALSNIGLPSPGTVAIRLPDPSTCEVIPSDARYWARCSRIFSSCPDVLGMRIKSISVVERRSEYIASLLSACTVSLHYNKEARGQLSPLPKATCEALSSYSRGIPLPGALAPLSPLNHP